MIPANTVYVELIEFFLAVFEEAPVVFAVEVVLLFCFYAVIILSLLHPVSHHGCLNANNWLEKQQDEVEAVDFVLFEVGTS